MANLPNIPFSNVRFVDVRDTLRGNGGSVSDDMASCFTGDAKINKWSWHRPIPHVDENIIPAWWDSKAAEVDYGFDVNNTHAVVELLHDLCAMAESAELIWPYPTEFSPMRLSDFAGYIPSAENPFAVIANVFYESGGYVLNVRLRGADLNTMAVTWPSLANYVGCGVALWKGNETHYYHFGTLSGTSGEYNAKLTNLSSGIWSCILCFDNLYQDEMWFDDPGGFDVLALPVESAHDLASFSIGGGGGGGGDDPAPQPSGITVDGEYDYYSTVMSDGNVSIRPTRFIFSISNESRSKFDSVVRLYTNTIHGRISQDFRFVVEPNDVYYIFSTDLDEQWSEWVLPAGESDPVIIASYNFQEVSYNYELKGNEQA